MHYIDSSLDEVEVAAWFRAADAMVVTSLADGMNLVAKEFVAARDDLGGTLILSEFTGAAQDLDGALIVNPYDIEAIKQAMVAAIEMPAAERAARQQTMRAAVEHNDVHRWARNFLARLESSTTARITDLTAGGAQRRPCSLQAGLTTCTSRSSPLRGCRFRRRPTAGPRQSSISSPVGSRLPDTRCCSSVIRSRNARCRRLSVIPAEDAARMGRASIELEHAIGAYELVKDCDIVHDHTLAGPIYSLRYPQLPVVTTNHNAFTRTYNALYGAVVPRVGLVAISKSHAASTHLPVDAVVYHGVDVADFPVGAGDGGYVALLGRMAANKGVHRAIAVARSAGVRLKIAAKMREPHERAYFEEFVLPHLGDDVVYLGEVDADGKRESARVGGGAAQPDQLARAVRHGHARVAGVRHPGRRLPAGSGAGDRRARPHRLPRRHR